MEGRVVRGRRRVPGLGGLEGEGVALTLAAANFVGHGLDETSETKDADSRLTPIRSAITLGGSNVAEWGSFVAPPSRPVSRGERRSGERRSADLVDLAEVSEISVT